MNPVGMPVGSNGQQVTGANPGPAYSQHEYRNPGGLPQPSVPGPQALGQLPRAASPAQYPGQYQGQPGAGPVLQRLPGQLPAGASATGVDLSIS